MKIALFEMRPNVYATSSRVAVSISHGFTDLGHSVSLLTPSRTSAVLKGFVVMNTPPENHKAIAAQLNKYDYVLFVNPNNTRITSAFQADTYPQMLPRIIAELKIPYGYLLFSNYERSLPEGPHNIFSFEHEINAGFANTKVLPSYPAVMPRYRTTEIPSTSVSILVNEPIKSKSITSLLSLLSELNADVPAHVTWNASAYESKVLNTNSMSHNLYVSLKQFGFAGYEWTKPINDADYFTMTYKSIRFDLATFPRKYSHYFIADLDHDTKPSMNMLSAMRVGLVPIGFGHKLREYAYVPCNKIRTIADLTFVTNIETVNTHGKAVVYNTAILNKYKPVDIAKSMELS